MAKSRMISPYCIVVGVAVLNRVGRLFQRDERKKAKPSRGLLQLHQMFTLTSLQPQQHLKMTTVTCHDIYNNQHSTPTASLQWRPAAYVVLIKDDSVCLLKTLNGTYDLPGGAIELGEDPKSAAIREVKEETGLDATEPTLLGVESSLFRAVHSDDRCYHSLLMYYHCEDFSGEFSNDGFDEVEKRLVEGAEWVPVAKLDEIRVGSTVDFRGYVRQAYEARRR
jgi:8-oxo-dGTP diphosphatase